MQNDKDVKREVAHTVVSTVSCDLGICIYMRVISKNLHEESKHGDRLY